MNSKLVWTEKYRPQTLNDIFSQDKNISLLNSKKFQKNIPHLLFSGPPGCGKTSTIFAFVRDIYGENYQNNIIEFNSFHERGINMIREKIKYFAKQIGNSSKWKIIILDEADTITQDSQFALRRIMEQYSKNTRFCIICNYINKIIEPIISRCSHFIFNNIPNENIKKYLQYIIQCEQININDIIIDKIIENCNNDMRYALNLLECYNYNCNCDLFGLIPMNLFNSVISDINNKKIEPMMRKIKFIYNNNYSITNQIKLFHNYILNLNINNKQKALLMIKLSEIDQNLLNGCNELIQYLVIFHYIYIVLNNNNDDINI